MCSFSRTYLKLHETNNLVNEKYRIGLEKLVELNILYIVLRVVLSQNIY
jgi:hypothetical protein